MSDLPSWAVRGRQVVCVDDWNALQCRKWQQITRGVVYTVAGSFCDAELGAYVLIEETVGSDGQYGEWRPSRFRPLVTLEDDITTYFADLLDVREPVGV